MKKVFFWFSLLLLTNSFAQSAGGVDTVHVGSWQEARELTFGLLPESHFQNYLLDRGSPYTKMAFANGTLTDSSFNMPEWYFIQNTIRMSYTRPDSIIGYLKLDSLKELYIRHNNILPWGLVDMNTHAIRDSAFYDGSMIVNNHRLTENTANLSKLYSPIKLFCAAPLSNEVFVMNPQFILLPQNILSNNSHSIVSIQIDLDDESGYRQVFINIPFQASYATGGFKQFVTRVVYSNGDTLYSRSELNIVSGTFESSGSCYTDPTDVVLIDGSYGSTNPLTFEGNAFNDYEGFSRPNETTSFAQVGIWYGCGNDTRKVRKPFIVFGGYNPKNGKSLFDNGNPSWLNDNLGGIIGIDGWRGPLYQTYDGFFTDFSRNAGGGQAFGSNGNNLLNRVRQEGYDILIVRFFSGVGYIQNNAFLVRQVLNYVNDSITDDAYGIVNPGADLDPETPGYPNTSVIKKAKHEIIIMGPSAGSLSSRLGLLWTESHESDPFFRCDPLRSKRYRPHRVKLWISMDHEAQGSNVPIGQQMFMDFGRSLWFYPSSPADISNTIAYNTAIGLLETNGVATQNTLYHMDNMQYVANGVWNVGHHSDFDSYYADLVSRPQPQDNLLGYPRKCYRIGVTQGSANGVTQRNSVDTDRLLYNQAPTDLCINPLGTLFGWGPGIGFLNFAIKFTPYREAEAKLLTQPSNLVFKCKMGLSIRTLAYTWHVTWPHWKYKYNNYLEDQTMSNGNWRGLDDAPASTLPSNLLLQKAMTLSSSGLPAAALLFCNYKDYNHFQAGFAPTVSGLDLHVPALSGTLPRYPDLSLVPGNVGGGLNLMQQNNYGLPPPLQGNSPNNNFGYPHITLPTNHYDYTPYDAIWANTTNNQNYDDNTMHVEDPNPEIGNFLVEEIAPYNLYLSNRTIKANSFICNGDIPQTEKYYADFEARNSILAGDQTIYQNVTNAANPVTSHVYPRKRTATGDFIVDKDAVVTMRANNYDGQSAVTLGAGFSAKNGSIFRAYVYGDSYCGTNFCGAGRPGGNASSPPPPVQTRPIITKRANSQKISTFSNAVQINLYPNPSQGNITYVINNKQDYDYVISDLMGKILQTGSFKGGVNTLNLQNFERGMYLVTVSNKNYKQTDRIIIQ